MSRELKFLLKYISIVSVNFKVEKKAKSTPKHNNPEVHTSRLMTAGKEAFSHDLNATFCLLRARSQTEVATSRPGEQAVQI